MTPGIFLPAAVWVPSGGEIGATRFYENSMRNKINYRAWKREYRKTARFKENKRAEDARRYQRKLSGRDNKPLKCDICGGEEEQIVWDHDHVTNQFRGWLCNRCNRVLGLMHDNPNHLIRMVEYLIQATVRATLCNTVREVYVILMNSIRQPETQHGKEDSNGKEN